jgi:hypothetical protein
MELSDPAEERRQFVRFENVFDENQKTPFLSIEIPELAQGPLQPEDLSSGGFRIHLPERPEVGTEIKCAIKIFESSLSNVGGQVVRVDKIESSPPSWAVGVSLDISDVERDILSSLLTVLISGDRGWKF